MWKLNRLTGRGHFTGMLIAGFVAAHVLAAAQDPPSVPAHITAVAATSTKSALRSTAPATPPHISVSKGDYRIGAGDVLDISVWKEPAVSVPTIIVRPDGKITLPLVKDISVAGLTTGQAEQVITKALSPFITDVDVTVIVTAINSKKIYIIGAVKREGPLAYTHRLTIMQALTEAGGLTDYAKRKKIYVLRSQNGKETRIPFNYNAALKGKPLKPVWLVPDDMLVIPH